MQVRIGELEEWKKENEIIIEDRDAQCEVAPAALSVKCTAILPSFISR